VLITGETGVGKEVVARALHDAGPNRGEPFMAVNCTSITETLLESELFGHERGAFTGAEKSTKGIFEATSRGTVFLDEIGDISPRLQTALLRVLETGEIRAVGSAVTRQISCRIVAATNAELRQKAAEGLFRQDLLFRLQRLCIHLSPLRERRQDIMVLVRHFLDTGRRIGIHATISESLGEALRSYDWPGNVRELRNVIERMRLMHSDKLHYDYEDLDLKFLGADAPGSPGTRRPAGRVLRDNVADVQEQTPPAGEWLASNRAVTSEQENESISSILAEGRSALRRQDRLRDIFRKHAKLTRSEIVRILNISPNTATKDLKCLCEEGMIDKVTPSASSRSHYFVLRPPLPEK
jgi:DNA-binding NtrC family response regulator